MSVNNGTSAILLIYQALNLKSGDEIILPGFGYMAAANLALQLGIKPVFVDIDEDTFCIDVKKIKYKITKKTKLIVAINTYGNICDFNDLNLLKKITISLFLKMLLNLWVQQLMGSNQEQIQILVHLVFKQPKLLPLARVV